MIVYRLTNVKHKDDLSGRGAEIAGGRWNSKGTAMIYTGQSRALCTTEIAVHSPLGLVPSNYWLVHIYFPEEAGVLELHPSKMPQKWNSVPHIHATQALGDEFISKGEWLAMRVPSAVVPGDFNYLLNPAHPLFSQVRIISTEPFQFDERLFIR